MLKINVLKIRKIMKIMTICDNGKIMNPPLTTIEKFQQLNSEFSHIKLSQE